MELTAPLYFTKACAAPMRLLKAVGAQRGNATHSPEAILVYPERDYQGDIVHPEGGDWSAFHRNPVVNFEHGPYIGTGELVMKSIPAPDPSESGMHPEPAPVDGRINVPFGTTKIFESAADLRNLQLHRYSAAGKIVGEYSPDECLRLADRMGPLIREKVIDGVSIEFTPEPSGRFQKSLGPVDGLGRDAFEFFRWQGISWAHCSVPVNAKARQVSRDEQEYVRAEKCLPVFEASWQDAELGSLIRKSLTPYLESILEPPKGRVTVATRMSPPSANGQHRKAFPPKKDDEEDTADDAPAAAKAPAAPPTKKPTPKEEAVAPQATATDGGADNEGEDDYGLGKRAAEATAPMDDGSEPVPVGIRASMDFVQALSDACGAYAEAMKASDNPKLIGFSNTEIGKVMKRAGFIQRYADAVGMKIKGGVTDDLDPEEDDADDDDTAVDPTEPDGDEEPDTDDEGKVISKAYSNYEPYRTPHSHLGPPVVRKAKVKVERSSAELDPDSHRLDALESNVSALGADLADILKALKR